MKRSFKLLFSFGLITGSLISTLFILRASSAQQTGSIAAKHVSMSMPAEREFLGRQLIGDLERCYEFMNAATNESLPRKVIINVNWDHSDTSCNRNQAGITIGMNQPAAVIDEKGFLFHSAAREIARLALIELSQGAEREDTEFLFEGMMEILVHEFDHSTRSLDAAWAFSRYLDEMQLLGLAAQRSWSSFSGGKHCLRNASPGITFLTTFRELQGRERPIKLFESLKKSGLLASLSLAFKAPVSDIENIWLKRVREYPIAEEITTRSGTAPRLLRTVPVPDTVKPGGVLQLRLFIEDRALNLLSNSIFVKDGRTGCLLPAQEATEKEAGYFVSTIPIDVNCPPGQFQYEVIAIDESGNLRRWSGNYTVAGRQ
jgi:hypothetical protein